MNANKKSSALIGVYLRFQFFLGVRRAVVVQLGSNTPRSVTIARINRYGVTSNAGL